MSARSEDTYLFIDGEYLRRRFDEAMRWMFLCPTQDEDIDYTEIKRFAGAKRVFFYDCIDDEKQSGESEAAFQNRVRAQESSFNKLGEMKGFHVRQGSLKGTGKKRRQKEIDVLLATDMLTHGYDGNMATAVLLAGDLDFRPAVENLVRRGVFVEVWYEPKSASAELPGAADYGKRLDFHTLHDWSTAHFKKHHPVPTVSDKDERVEGKLIKEGLCGGRKVLLIERRDNSGSVLRYEGPDHPWLVYHADPGVLERFVPLIYGTIDWK
jgi:uncharacterized LabA/DUF88 family protein